ncbi:MAG TPA: rhomboid family intramembrane serine protease [Gemmataceae bacterium]|nr:rhomboid family intramembrane serine protease [Gemmataceae bacterium]
MGIYDRDYVRREGPSFLGSFVERGRICKWLIGINVAAFIVQVLTLPHNDKVPGFGWFTDAFHLTVPDVLHGQVWRLLTYAFLHDTDHIMHILFNMLFLWWFGSDVEDLYGPREFLTFYLTSAFVGGFAYFLSSLVWLPTAAPCVGASGGVMAVILLCAIHYPRRTILLFFILPVPIWLFVAFSLALDGYVFLDRNNNENRETAVAAHLGGALFAGVYYKLHWRLTNWLPQFRAWRRQLSRPRLRVYHEDDARRPVRVPAATVPPEDDQLEAKMDAILEKISRVGKENLTENERQLLLRASEIFRRRRP